MDDYSVLGRIGEGAHGIVMKVKTINIYSIILKICHIFFSPSI
jgi:hypothetical protein